MMKKKMAKLMANKGKKKKKTSLLPRFRPWMLRWGAGALGLAVAVGGLWVWWSTRAFVFHGVTVHPQVDR